MKVYLINLFIALDQLVNAATGGSPDETVSSRAHRRRLAGKPRLALIINRIVFWQPDHCAGEYLAEVAHAKAFPEGKP